MTMNIVLFKCTDDPKVMRKTLRGPVANLECQIKDDCGVIRPTVIIKSRSNVLNSTDVNYFQIPDWKRYYFIKELITHPDGTTTISGEVDVLNSWKSSLNDLDVVVTRSSGGFSGGSEFLPDNTAVFDVRPKTRVIPFNRGTNDGFDTNLHFIIHTSGT